MKPRFRESLSPVREGVSHDGAVEIGASNDEKVSDEGAIRIALIGDLILVRAGLRHLLEASGVGIVGEATCEEAAPLVERERPDILLVDLDSRSDVFGCLERLLGVPGDGRVIVLSERRLADHSALVEYGVMGLVLKSAEPDILLKAIRKVHAGELWLDRLNTAEVVGRLTRRRQVENLESMKIASLTKREREITDLVGEGLKNAAIAERLFISEATVRNHLTSILDKLGVSDRFELAVYAFRHGLVRYAARGDAEKKDNGKNPPNP
jgi:two-component system, NarL family, nitrate/nitrite response regulator NarL